MLSNSLLMYNLLVTTVKILYSSKKCIMVEIHLAVMIILSLIGRVVLNEIWFPLYRVL